MSVSCCYGDDKARERHHAHTNARKGQNTERRSREESARGEVYAAHSARAVSIRAAAAAGGIIHQGTDRATDADRDWRTSSVDRTASDGPSPRLSRPPPPPTTAILLRASERPLT